MGATARPVPARRPFARLEGIAAGRAGLLLIGVWAFAEAVLFPIIPNAAIGLPAMVAPRRVPRLFAALVLGALAGTVVLYALTLAALTLLGLLAPGFLRRHDRLTLVVYVGCYAIAYPVYWSLAGG